MDDSAEPLDLGALGERGARYAALLRQGRRIAVVDEDGQVMGHLVPQAKARLTPADRTGSPFERLVAAGQVRPASGNLLDLPPSPPAEPGERPLSEIALEMRDEERS